MLVDHSYVKSSPTLKERIVGTISPVGLIFFAIHGFIITFVDILFRQRNPAKLFDIAAVRDQAFSHLWLNYGAKLSVDMPGKIVSILPSAHGIVLDVGPGSGEQLSRFKTSAIKRAYGVEPCVHLHEKLLESSRLAGFDEDSYVALPCGAEQETLIPALAKEGLLGGTNGSSPFDTVVCVRVLCGVPRPRETIAGLYRLLKPGGRLIVCEHVRNPGAGAGPDGSLIGAAFQNLFVLMGWSVFLGSCELKRNTVVYIREAAGGDGGWAAEEIEIVNGWSPVPFAVGVFTKKQ